MSFYIDVHLPIGIRIEAQFRDKFSGILKSLLGEVLKDLEENSSKHYSYFMRERLSREEKKMFRVILQEVQEEHFNKIGVSLEQLGEIPRIDLNQVFNRYKEDQ